MIAVKHKSLERQKKSLKYFFAVKDPLSLIIKISIYASALFTIGMLLFIILYISVKGIPYLNADLFSIKYTSDNLSLFPALINTLIISSLSILLAAPLGIFAAIYLNEYASKKNKIVSLIRLTTETLAGIPSIIYGLFGMFFFVIWLGMGLSILAGACTLAIMILPTIMRTAEEALKAVPDSFREASFALGAGKTRTIFRIILPSAINGILAGIILSIGRTVGETAVLIYTAGTVADLPENLLSSGRTLAVHMYNISSEALYINQAYATAFVLLITVLIINRVSSFTVSKLGNKYK